MGQYGFFEQESIHAINDLIDKKGANKSESKREH